MNEKELRGFAHEGAKMQIDRIVKEFPDLAPAAPASKPAPAAAATKGKGNGRTMSPEAREAISRRMKANWRKRRRAEKEKGNR